MAILNQAAHNFKQNSQDVFAIFAICRLSDKCSGPERITKHQTGVTPSAQRALSLSAQPAMTPHKPRYHGDPGFVRGESDKGYSPAVHSRNCVPAEKLVNLVSSSGKNLKMNKMKQ